MSRSKKKTPIFGNAGGSEKQDKRIANRKLRRKVNELNKKPDEDVQFPKIKEVSNPWGMSKDGKHYSGEYSKKNNGKAMRK